MTKGFTSDEGGPAAYMSIAGGVTSWNVMLLVVLCGARPSELHQILG